MNKKIRKIDMVEQLCEDYEAKFEDYIIMRNQIISVLRKRWFRLNDKNHKSFIKSQLQ